MLLLLPRSVCLEVGLPLLPLPGCHWVGALVVLAVGSPFGIRVCHREIKAPGSAGVLDAGLWDQAAAPQRLHGAMVLERKGWRKAQRWVV